jgi:hypothetical protein
MTCSFARSPLPTPGTSIVSSSSPPNSAAMVEANVTSARERMGPLRTMRAPIATNSAIDPSRRRGLGSRRQHSGHADSLTRSQFVRFTASAKLAVPRFDRMITRISNGPDPLMLAFGKTKLEGLFAEALEQLQPTPGCMRLVTETVLSAWGQRKVRVREEPSTPPEP